MRADRRAQIPCVVVHSRPPPVLGALDDARPHWVEAGVSGFFAIFANPDFSPRTGKGGVLTPPLPRLPIVAPPFQSPGSKRQGVVRNPGWHGKIKVREELNWLEKYGGSGNSATGTTTLPH